MKITAIILLSACLTASAKGLSQKVTLSEKNAPIETVFREIKKQTGYSFFFNVDLLKKASKVTIEVKDALLQTALDICFKDQPLSYSIVGNTVVVEEKQVNPKIERITEMPAPINVHGRIVNENGEPVDGATVKIKGTETGTSTNANGEFNLAVPTSDMTLIISGVNIETQEVKINARTNISITAKTKVDPLDQVQIIAYGATTQRLSTGNISTVKGEDIQKQPVNNPLLALEGRVPGLFITQANGIAGGAVTVRIQGINSIQGGNDPLYVIDGVPYTSEMLTTTTGGPHSILGKSLSGTSVAAGSGNPLSYINPNDIESISVLKDAEATSIYGSRAANGAILITTKKGKAGKEKINIDIQNGWGAMTGKLDVMNTQQYLQMRHEALNNDGLMPDPNNDYDIALWDTTKNTNWEQALFRQTSQYMTANANISGGSATMQYLVGGTYHRETSQFQGNFSDQKASAHFSLNTITSNQKFRFQLSASYMNDNNQLPQLDLTQVAYTLPPDAPSLYNPDGSLNWGPLTPSGNSSFGNPLQFAINNYQSKTNNLISNASLDYLIAQGLTIGSTFGYTNLQTKEYSPTSLLSFRPEVRATSVRSASYTNSVISTIIEEPQINYKRQLGKGKLDLLLGTTIQQTNSDGSNLKGTGFPTEKSMENIGGASSIIVNSVLNSVYKYNALFGRINYNYKDEYILSLTGRRDGSSRFGPANEFHNFGSVSAGWIFSNESFFKKLYPALSFAKINASYGTSGNDQIGDYSYLNLYNTISGITVPYQGSTSLAVSRISNPFLQWEETKKVSIGLNLGFLKDRIILNTVYSQNRSSNELIDYALPIFVGVNSVTRNFPATVQNQQWEISFTSQNLKSNKFTWSSSFNLTIPRNKLVAFPNLSTSTYASTLIIGQPISILKVFQFLGVNDTTGLYQFASQSGPTSNPFSGFDNNTIINTLPKFYGGLQNTFTYKGFQLDFLIQFVKQIGLQPYALDGQNDPAGFANNNEPISVLNRWQRVGDKATIEKYNSDGSIASQWYDAVVLSDAAYSDASYIRLKNLSVSYSLPDKWVHKMAVENCIIYIQTQNLITITKYKGIDPETQGISSLPPLKVFVLGLHMGF